MEAPLGTHDHRTRPHQTNEQDQLPVTSHRTLLPDPLNAWRSDGGEGVRARASKGCSECEDRGNGAEGFGYQPSLHPLFFRNVSGNRRSIYPRPVWFQALQEKHGRVPDLAVQEAIASQT